MYESILSRSPPWPGINLPLSLTFALLFKIDSNKSPPTAMSEPISTIIKYAQIGKLVQRKLNPVMFAKMSQTQLESKIDQRMPPIVPETVFPGLILGQSFLPPIREPVSIANVSTNIGIKIAVNRTKIEISALKSTNFVSESSLKWLIKMKKRKKNEG